MNFKAMRLSTLPTIVEEKPRLIGWVSKWPQPDYGTSSEGPFEYGEDEVHKQTSFIPFVEVNYSLAKGRNMVDELLELDTNSNESFKAFVEEYGIDSAF